MGGDLRSLKRLVGEAADINCVVDDLGCSALVLSCYFTHYECAKYLLSMGADFELADNEGVCDPINFHCSAWWWRSTKDCKNVG